MDSDTQRQHLETLRRRQADMAEAWYRAVGRTGYVTLLPDQVRARLADLVGQLVSLLATQPLDRRSAEQVGAALAGLHLVQAESLAGTLEVLGRELARGLHPDEARGVDAHLATLLGAVAGGYFRQACRTILSEQEETRNALVTELRVTEQQLRQARDELEVRVRERTAELARLDEGLQTEIAERQRAEQALQESEERWRSLVENAPDIVVTLDRRGQILYINRVAERETETVDDVIGTDAFRYVQPEHRPALREALNAAFEGREGAYLEVAIPGARGVPVWQAVRLGPVWREGQVVSVMAIVRDISEQRQVQELKDNLIRDVSHEIRNPLAKVRMSLDVLAEIMAAEQVDRDRAERIGELATRNVDRLLQTVEGVLDLSRLEAGVWPRHEQAIELEELVAEAIQYMAPLALSKNLRLTANWPAERLPIVTCDREGLFRVLLNLLDNAIKFTAEGQVVVSARALENVVEVAVADTGRGIEPELLGRIFDRFYQGGPQAEGVGIGLTICKAIVEAHGGRIWAESRGRGQGATFRFTLPLEAGGSDA